MIMEHLQNRVQWFLFEAHSFVEHSINSLTINDSEMPQIIVVSLEQERQLTCILC